MTIRLVLEYMPAPQHDTERLYYGGQMIVGRGDTADWRIDDPDMLVSRKHFVISDDTGTPSVTDASTGGLYIDEASEPLGAGNTVELKHGMRLSFGEFVLRIDLEDEPTAEAGNTTASATLRFDFDPVEPSPPPQERPKDLPPPFGVATSSQPDAPDETANRSPRPLEEDDPFALDLSSAPRAEIEPSSDQPKRKTPSGGYFDTFDASSEPEPRRDDQQPESTKETPPPKSRKDSYFEALDAPLEDKRQRTAPPPRSAEDASPTQTVGTAPFGALGTPPEAPSPQAEPPPVEHAEQAPPPRSHDDDSLRAAFFAGLGLDPNRHPTDDPAMEMEAFGRRFRALADGLVYLLHTRAEEKQKVRVAQTIIGSANVNPLKFAVGANDAVEALVSVRGPGYLAPDDAIHESYRDLADHQVRTWTALQRALRRMIDRFDPKEIERELENTGVLEALLAGGRGAKLWQLYNDRYHEIARAAEERFLGEVGTDFRDAYEKRERD